MRVKQEKRRRSGEAKQYLDDYKEWQEEAKKEVDGLQVM